MTFEEALRIRTGDKIYTHCGKIVVISGFVQSFEDPCVKDDLYFYCIDTSFKRLKYRYDELCGPELCDEDKMFIDWYSKYTPKNDDIIPYLKKAFMQGFQCGFSHKQKAWSQDQLQK